MGVDFDCIFDVAVSRGDVLALGADVLAIPARLDQLKPELEQIFDTHHWNFFEPDRAWCYELEPSRIGFAKPDHADDDGLDLMLIGPYGFVGQVWQHVVSIGHLTRWKWFMNDEFGAHDRLTVVSRLFARRLGARRLIYLSDLGSELLLGQAIVCFDDMLEHLERKWGPPSAWNPPYEIGEGYWKTYFVETLPAT
jgi:hypothetical protein